MQWELERAEVFPSPTSSLLSCKGRYKVATALTNGSPEVSQRNGGQGRGGGTLPGEKPSPHRLGNYVGSFS